MSDQLVVEREGLEKKDKNELQTIVSALGGNAPARMRKAELIDQILELSGATARARGESAAPADTITPDSGSSSDGSSSDGSSSDGSSSDGDAGGKAADSGSSSDRSASADRRSGSQRSSKSNHPVGADGEPLSDWEVEVMDDRSSGGGGRRGGRDNNRNGGGQNSGNQNSGGQNSGNQNGGRKQTGDNRNRGDNQSRGGNNQGQSRNNQSKGNDDNNQSSNNQNSNNQNSNNNNNQGNNNQGNNNQNKNDEDDGNRRSRRRGRNRGRDRDDAGDEAITDEQTRIEGYLDLRDEGYAFLRVNGFLPSRDDAYVSVKQVRQNGLRKGDHVVGYSRPANRNEKNPALHEIESVNGSTPDDLGERVDFDDLTPVFPDERLTLERPADDAATVRLIDLVAPIGKGQRGLIISPPKSGKTTVIAEIAKSIEANNPEVELLVLLIDERPEEVTEMERLLERGEVVSTTFDRPADEHIAVADITLERAKRRVENGADVMILVDGITRLARASNISGPHSGRVLSGGIDAAALYPPKRFLGAARNLEEGGSLTILATVAVETGSEMDDTILRECEPTGNSELRLDRSLADKGVFPAIDVARSATRHEDRLRDEDETAAVRRLRHLAAESDAESANGAEAVIDRLTRAETNEGFLADLAKSPV